jgi:hypothetical protein
VPCCLLMSAGGLGGSAFKVAGNNHQSMYRGSLSGLKD